ncbi:phosphoglycolate phosphatase [Rhodovibrionaceae bacterium A322]
MPHAPLSSSPLKRTFDSSQRPVALFDLDGTLIHSAPDLARALNLLLVELDQPPLALDQVIAMVGNGARKLVERGLEARHLEIDLEEATRRFMGLYGRNLVVDTTLYDGVIDRLNDFRAEGWRLAVCTNKPQWASRAILGRMGLAGYFELVVGGNAYAVKKPDPFHLLHTLERMGASQAPCVMVGDGAPDLGAAQAAGIPVVWCRFGYINAAAEALPRQAEVDHFEQITPALLQSLL